MSVGSRIERKKYERNQKRRSPKRLIKKLVIGLITLFFLLIIGGAGLFGYYAMNAPSITASDLQGQVSSKIYDQYGELIKELGGQNRSLLDNNEIPQVLEDAVLAIEDARFYNHTGVDPIRIVGSLVANINAGEIVQGGSTITQQLVKLSVFSTDFQDQTLERKAQEAWLAMKVEQDYSKEEILTLYLNKLFYSNNIYGAKTAAESFFNKNISDITLAEAALLAGLPQAPSQYDPYAYPEAAKERRDLVLYVMHDRGMINDTDYQAAVDTSIESMLTPLPSNNQNITDFAIDAYLDIVALEVQDRLNINIYTDGVEVYTNLDFQAQEHLYHLVNDEEAVIFGDDNMQTAVTVIDVDTGQLKAVIGGRKQDVTMGLNRSNTLARSIGSTMKPLSSYGPALEYLDYSTGQLIVDEPYEYTDGSEINNYDFDYKGNMTLREALASSRNIPALKLLQSVGLDNAYAFLQKMDINILNDNQRQLVESNAIGGEVTPVQLVAAYASIANNGEYRAPYTVSKVVTQSGTVEEFQPEARQAMKDTTAYMLVDMLKGVPGTFASSAGINGLYHAGKTGTTNYSSDQLAQLGLDESTYAAPDAWYVGMTPQYAIASWVGYDNPNQPGNYLSLSETAIPQHIYREMMSYLMQDIPVTDWTIPEGLVQVEIEKYTNPILLPGPYTPMEARSIELFLTGREPKEQSLAYGRYIQPPTNFQTTYNQQTEMIDATWDPLTDRGMFELSLNGAVVYTGTETQFSVPASEDGEYVLRLRIIDGVSASDTLVMTLTITSESRPDTEVSESDSNDTSDSEEDSEYDDDPIEPPSDDESQSGDTVIH